MDLRDIICGNPRIKPESLLKGSYAFSHRGEFETGGNFIPQTFVGFMEFDGLGTVKSEGVVNRNGGTPFQPVNNTGTYTATISNAVIIGTIQTKAKFSPTEDITIDYSFVMADNGNDLKYAAQKVTVTNTQTNISTTKRVLVVGTMRKVWL